MDTMFAWKLRGAVSPAGEIVKPVCRPLNEDELQGTTGTVGDARVGSAVLQYGAPEGPPSP